MSTFAYLQQKRKQLNLKVNEIVHKPILHVRILINS